MRKKLAALCLMLSLLTVSVIGLTACGAKLQLTLKSEKEATVVVGTAYELNYEATAEKVEVTVTSGAELGTYDAATKKFMATAVGNAVLSVVATSGKEKLTEKVNIKIVAADKASLATAIDSAEALVSTDYTSFTAVTAKLKIANDLLENANATESAIATAITELNAAVTALVPKAITKAVLEDNKITYSGKSYEADVYSNLTAVLAAIKAINDDATIKLSSVYKTKVLAELAKLKEFEVLEIKGIAAGHVVGVPESSYSLTAAAANVTEIEWYVNGEKKFTGETFTFESVADTAYEIMVLASKSDDVKQRGMIEVAFHSSNTFRAQIGSIVVENEQGTITETKKEDWGQTKPEGGIVGITPGITFPVMKAMGNLWLDGDFKVQFDVLPTAINSAFADACVAFLMTRDPMRGHMHEYEFAIKYGKDRLNLWGNNDDVSIGNVLGENGADTVLAENVKQTFLVERVDGYLSMSILSADGAKLFTATTEGKMAKMTERVNFNFNFEQVAAIVSNFKVSADRIINMSALSDEIVLGQSLIESDYEAAGWSAYKKAVDDAFKGEYVQAAGQDVYNTCAANLNALRKALVKKTFAKATTDDSGISYAEVQYNKAIYKVDNYNTIVEEIALLNADTTVTLASEYDAKIKAILDRLVPLTLLPVTCDVPVGYAQYDSNFGTFVFTADAAAFPNDISWYVNGVKQTNVTGETFTFEPTSAGTYYIKAEVKLDEAGEYMQTFETVVNSLSPEFVSYDTSKITVNKEDGTITSQPNDIGGWFPFIKVRGNFWLIGDFEMVFDITRTSDATNTLAIILSRDAIRADNNNGNWDEGEIAIKYTDKRLDVQKGGGQLMDVPEAWLAKSTVATFKLMRKDGVLTLGFIDKGTGAWKKNANKEMFANGTMPMMDNINVNFNWEGMGATFDILSIKADSIVCFEGLLNAVSEANALIESDYSAGWQAVQVAKDAAVSAIANSAIKQKEADELVKELRNAIAALTKTAITKAVVTDVAITFMGMTLEASNYTNFSEVKAQVEALNEEDLASNYTTIYSVLNTLQCSNVVLTLDKASGIYGFANPKDEAHKLIITPTSADADFTAMVDGTAQELVSGSLTVSGLGKHVVAVKATKGSAYAVQFLHVELVKDTFQKANLDVKLFEVLEDGTVAYAAGQTDFPGWGDGRKITSNVWLRGDFKITFDAKMDEFTGDAKVIAINLSPNNDFNHDARGEFAIRYQSGKLAINGGGNESAEIAGLKESNEKYSYVISRTGGVLKFEILNADGTTLGAYSKDNGFTADVRIMVNFENVKGSVSNIAFWCESVR